MERFPVPGRPMVFGEVLFDHFEDGSAVLGGAPFNVAWHLCGFGAAPLLITRVGPDREGRQIIETMRHWGMDVRGVQHDEERPTGQVRIALHDGQPDFQILPDQAYDFIDAQQAIGALGDELYSLCYHGTLALRRRDNAAVLDQLLQVQQLPVFLDVNLRPPWWEAASMHRYLERARWAKLNEAELQTLSRSTNLSLKAAALSLRNSAALELLIMTRGAEGGQLFTSVTMFSARPVPGLPVVDTVGAGDAFAAVILLGLMRGWPMQQALHHAVEFAALVCGVRGATLNDTQLYRNLLLKWEDSHH